MSNTLSSLDCVFHRIGCFDNSSNQSINVAPDWITGHQHVVVHALSLNVLNGLNQAQQRGPLAFPRMSKNQLASELASLGIRALVGKPKTPKKSRRSRSRRHCRQGSSSSASSDGQRAGAYKGKYWQGAELPVNVVRYAELPAKLVMEALHVINSKRCSQQLSGPHLSIP